MTFTAYATKRAKARNTTNASVRHAVEVLAVLSGALDAECGQLGAVLIGPWNPADPLNCRDCSAALSPTVALSPTS